MFHHQINPLIHMYGLLKTPVSEGGTLNIKSPTATTSLQSGKQFLNGKEILMDCQMTLSQKHRIKAVTYLKIKILSLSYNLTQRWKIFYPMGKEWEAIVAECSQFTSFYFVSFCFVSCQKQPQFESIPSLRCSGHPCECEDETGFSFHSSHSVIFPVTGHIGILSLGLSMMKILLVGAHSQMPHRDKGINLSNLTLRKLKF